MTTNAHENDRSKDIAALLQTIGRAAVTGHGIPTFGDVIQAEPDDATSLIVAHLGMGDLSRATIEDLKHDVIAYASAGNKRDAEAAFARLDDAFGNRQTNYCEAFYLVGVAMALRAISKARALVNLDITNVLAELAAKDREKGGDRG